MEGKRTGFVLFNLLDDDLSVDDLASVLVSLGEFACARDDSERLYISFGC